MALLHVPAHRAKQACTPPSAAIQPPRADALPGHQVHPHPTNSHTCMLLCLTHQPRRSWPQNTHVGQMHASVMWRAGCAAADLAPATLPSRHNGPVNNDMHTWPPKDVRVCKQHGLPLLLAHPWSSTDNKLHLQAKPHVRAPTPLAPPHLPREPWLPPSALLLPLLLLLLCSTTAAATAFNAATAAAPDCTASRLRCSVNTWRLTSSVMITSLDMACVLL
jgi:hypothetical protein